MQARAPIVFDAPAIPAPAPDRSPQMPLPQLPPAPEPRTERPVVTGVFEERRIGEQAAAPRVMQASGFEVAPTPVAGAKANAAPPVPRSAGFGDTASGASSGSRVRQVASAGFGAASGGQAAMAQARVIRSTGFEEAVVAAAAHRPPESRPSSPASTGVEIIHKPRPAYTDEARRLQIEGEVLVEALFTAAGEVRVLRIVRGLGHGLDESALAAAGGIRFRPATRNGTPEDATATVRITFQLAY
jgi:TonB family protein